ncbi:MAG TPA: phosphate ABC transporter substrate-binding protein, partial [Burkholderiaceae bacterium]|nr:phosphate ABC transporter substrate-binding protein [Burkholderiaceae bacterium]
YGHFYAQVAGRSEAQIKAYWSRMVFTGKGAPPQEVGDGAAVKKLLANNPNLVGYIDAAQVDGSVKVLAEIK